MFDNAYKLICVPMRTPCQLLDPKRTESDWRRDLCLEQESWAKNPKRWDTAIDLSHLKIDRQGINVVSLAKNDKLICFEKHFRLAEARGLSRYL